MVKEGRFRKKHVPTHGGKMTWRDRHRDQRKDGRKETEHREHGTRRKSSRTCTAITAEIMAK